MDKNTRIATVATNRRKTNQTSQMDHIHLATPLYISVAVFPKK